MPTPVRAGMIGTSWYADFMHLPSLTSHLHAQVTPICGRNTACAHEMAQKYAIPHVFDDAAIRSHANGRWEDVRPL